MANRSYLYAADKELKKLRDLSEANYSIPIEYKILLSVNTTICKSRIWDVEEPIALTGDFKEGLKRLYDFLEYYLTQPIADKEEIKQRIEETKTYFLNPEKNGDLFFMEAGEIYDLTGDPLEEQNMELYNEIVAMGKDITEILEKRPADLFGFSNAYWLKSLKQNKEAQLELYWANVLYFSFNNS